MTMYYDNRNQDAKPTTTGEKVTTGILLCLFLSLLTAEIISDYEPKKLSALLFIIFWGPLLIIHEVGHAMMAKLLDWRVNRIVLGVGKMMLRRQWFNAPVEIRAIPIEGFVQIAPKDIRGARWKHALIYFAGPGIELCCVLLIAMLLGGFHELFTITNDYGRIILQSFAFAALAGAVMNLVPQGITTKDGSTPNDGMGILLCLLSSDTDYEQWVKDSQQIDEEAF